MMDVCPACGKELHPYNPNDFCDLECYDEFHNMLFEIEEERKKRMDL